MYRGKYVMISSTLLLIVGVVMIYSASNVWAAEKLGDKYRPGLRGVPEGTRPYNGGTHAHPPVPPPQLRH